MIKCIIFDFDGVIAETDEGRFQLLSEILIDYNINLLKDFHYSDTVGISTYSFLKLHYGKNLSDFDIENIVDRRSDKYLKNLNKFCSPIPGAIKTIIDLKNKSHELYICTTNDEIIINTLLQYLKIVKYFSRVFPRNEIKIKGSLLKNYRYVLDEVNCDISDSLVIEDSEIGVKSALVIGALTVHFGSKKIDIVDDNLIHASNYNELNKLIASI